MSYNANGHATQMAMLKQLLLSPSAGFAELQKTADVTSDFANFHLKQLVTTGYVRKLASGKYTLTHAGKEYANRMDTDEKVLEKQAKLSVWLVVDDGKGKFLAQQRLKQPYYGYWGRLGGKMRWGETVLEAAARELKEETDLTADFEFKGIYHKTDYNKAGDLLEDKFFYLVHATKPKGTLKTKFEGGLNQWMTDEEFKSKDKYFESALQATSLAIAPGMQFVEKKHVYDEEDY
jgi:ADP-ribose pyrophosphatase YjhB (NUDIX family)